MNLLSALETRLSADARAPYIPLHNSKGKLSNDSLYCESHDMPGPVSLTNVRLFPATLTYPGIIEFT